MWILKDEGNSERRFYLVPGKEYQVGRKECSIRLLDDSSISRKHSVIKVETSCLKENPEILLTDYSKYGTTVNGVKVTKPINLKANDVIHFGQSHHKFRLLKNPIVVVTSCINDKEQKLLIKKVIHELGGEISSDWNPQCTHLIMENVTFTIKAVCALACSCPIVTPRFFEDFLRNVEDSSKPPINPVEYIPEVFEPSLKGLGHLFIPNIQRKEIFAGKTFKFLSNKQFKRLAPAIQMAGGNAQLIDSLKEYSADDVMIIAPEAKDETVASTEEKKWIQSMIERLNGANLRAIKESEVGLAILHLSLEIYCNPSKFSDDSIAGTTSSQVIHDTVLDNASQWQMTSKMENNDAEFKRPHNVLASDSQADMDRKRKRSSDTSMYITDTIPLDTALPFHLAKKPKKESSPKKNTIEEKAKRKITEGEAASSKTKNVENSNGLRCNGKDREKLEEGNKNNENREHSDVKNKKMAEEAEIEELTNSIMEDDGDFEEDLFALDTEKQMAGKQEKKGWGDRSGLGGRDISRVAESQVPGDLVDNEDANVDDTAISVKKNQSGGWMQKSDITRVSQSQFTEDNCNGDMQLGTKVKNEETDYSLESSHRDNSGKRELNDEAEGKTIAPHGFKNAKIDKRNNDVKPEIDPDEPAASTVVSFSALVVRKSGKIREPAAETPSVKNFKKFKKNSFPGKERIIPKIIGGSDLVAFESTNEEKIHLFDELRANNERKERERKHMDQLFKMDLNEPRKGKRR